MRAINSSVMRKVNRCMVMNLIRKSAVSRAEIAEATQLTRASITQIVDELMREGLVKESEPVSGGGPGRKQRKLSLVEDALCVAGVSLNRRGYDLGVINLGGEVLFSSHGEAGSREAEEVIDEIAASLRAAAERLEPRPRRIYGVGVSLPARVLSESRQPWYQDIGVEEMLRERLSWEVYPGDVSASYALDELYFGIGSAGVEDFMLIHVDERVSAGFVLGGELFVSSRGHSPQLGYVTLCHRGTSCGCEGSGGLEDHIAFPAALEGTPFASWRQVVDSVDADPRAAELFQRVARDLAAEILNIINVLDLDRVVLSGDYVYGGERLAGAVNRQIRLCSLRRSGDEAVTPGRKDEMARICAMPAFHTIFAC